MRRPADAALAALLSQCAAAQGRNARVATRNWTMV